MIIHKVSPLVQLKHIKELEARFTLLAEGKISVKDCTGEELRAFQVMMYDAVEKVYEPIMVQPNNYIH